LQVKREELKEVSERKTLLGGPQDYAVDVSRSFSDSFSRQLGA
jgi:hypothetical protein